MNSRFGQAVSVILAVALLGGLVLTVYAVNQARSLQSEAARKFKTTDAEATIQLNETNPHLGGNVTFATTFSKKVKNPRVSIRCYQSEELVYGEAGSYNHTFLLGGAGSKWLTNGGSASCVADLFFFWWPGNHPQEVHWLSQTSFEAGGAQ